MLWFFEYAPRIFCKSKEIEMSMKTDQSTVNFASSEVEVGSTLTIEELMAADPAVEVEYSLEGDQLPQNFINITVCGQC